VALILASGSPRRRELLHYSAVNIADVRPSQILEERNEGEEPLVYCRRLALEKSRAVSEEGYWILAADTIVCLGDAVFEKPADRADAIWILSSLSGQWHQVISAWTLRYCPKNGEESKEISGYASSDVLLRELLVEEIEAYVSSGESMDKAGGYGIQGLGACLVSEIKGSYSNIVGLPLSQVLKAIREEGVFDVD
jgi:septum formation protein